MSSEGSNISLESATTAETSPNVPQAAPNVSETSRTTRKTASTPNSSKLNRTTMTTEEKKKHKDAISLKYFSLMEKYGPRRKVVSEKDLSLDDVQIEPVGFVIKFRLSHAYKALEKQEIEAAIPDIKPVRKRKHTKFLLPPEDKSSDQMESGYTDSEKPSSEAGTLVSQSESTRRFQIRAKLKNKTTKETQGIWQTLTKQKASLAQQKKEQQKQDIIKGSKGKNKTIPQKMDQKNQKQTKAQQTVVKDNQKSIEQNLEQLKADVRARQKSRHKEARDSHFQGINIPGSVGATDYCSTGGDIDSIFRMFSDSMYSGSITMDALTISGSRPSSPSKSMADPSSRPSSAAGSLQRGKHTPKPRTSTPGPPTRPSSPARTNKTSGSSKNNSGSTTGKGKSSSGTPVNKSQNDTKPGTKPRNLSAFLRPEGARGKAGAEVKDDKEEESKKVLAPRKIEKYLYRMCNCHQVARKETLSKLFKKKKVAGVIDLFGCPDKTDPRSEVLFCPFCTVLPRKRINTWLDNLEED